MKEIRIIPIQGVPEVEEGDDVAALISDAAGGAFEDGDAVVVTQKVISKAEGRMIRAADRIEAAMQESTRVLRRTPGMVISETRHGFVCANAGIDASNVEHGYLALLPLDPDASARRVRARIGHLTGADVAVVISDTFGRAWRVGQTDIAIGVAGMDPFTDYRGTQDVQGNELSATRICTADEIAGAAELVMGKAEAICAAIVRGARLVRGRGAATDIVRAPADDLFR